MAALAAIEGHREGSAGREVETTQPLVIAQDLMRPQEMVALQPGTANCCLCWKKTFDTRTDELIRIWTADR